MSLKQSLTFHKIYYFYLTAHKNILKYLNGGTRAKLNKGELLGIEFNIPKSKQEQTAIADILIKADDAIEALEKKRKVIEAQKKFLLNNLIAGTIRTPETLRGTL